MLNSTLQNASFQRDERLGSQRIAYYYGTQNSLPCLKEFANNAHLKPYKSTTDQCKLCLQTPFKCPYSYTLRSCKKHLFRNSTEYFVRISHLSFSVMARLRFVRPRDSGSIAGWSKERPVWHSAPTTGKKILHRRTKHGPRPTETHGAWTYSARTVHYIVIDTQDNTCYMHGSLPSAHTPTDFV